MEKQLTALEEIIVHSSNQIKVSLKNKSELIMQLNLEIFELVCAVYIASDNGFIPVCPCYHSVMECTVV